jgi:hypothetical protein
MGDMSVSPLTLIDELRELQLLMLLFSMIVLSIHEAESVSEAVSRASRLGFFCIVGRLFLTFYSKKKREKKTLLYNKLNGDRSLLTCPNSL